MGLYEDGRTSEAWFHLNFHVPGYSLMRVEQSIAIQSCESEMSDGFELVCETSFERNFAAKLLQGDSLDRT